MLNKLKIASLALLFCLFSCTSEQSAESKKNSNYPQLKIENDSLIVVNNKNNRMLSFDVRIGDRVSFTDSIMSNTKICVDDILKSDKDSFYYIAFLLAKGNGDVEVNLGIDNVKDTTIVIHINSNIHNQYDCEVLEGACAQVSELFSAENAEPDIIRWLYRNKVSDSNDSLINEMRLYLNELNKTGFKEYIVNDPIPVVNSLKSKNYRISSNLIADHYYLLAHDNERGISKFIEEMISRKYPFAANSLEEPMHCQKWNSTVGTLGIFLIGINNDWTSEIVPAGLISYDTIGPSFYNFYTEQEEYKIPMELPSYQIRISSNYGEPNILGNLNMEHGDFQGYGTMLNVPYTFYFQGDVKKIIVHKSKSSSEEIDLKDETSPVYRTIRTELYTGDNYIAIDAIDVRGNKTTYDYHIATERVNNDKPVFENNIFN